MSIQQITPTPKRQLLADASAIDLGWNGKQKPDRLLPDPQGRNDGRWHRVQLAGGGSIDVRFARWKGGEPVFEAKGQSATIMKLEGFQSFSAAASNAAERTRGGALKPIYANPLQSVAEIPLGKRTLGQMAQSGWNTAGQVFQNTPLPVVGVTPKQASQLYDSTAGAVNRSSTAIVGRPVLPQVPTLKPYQAQLYGGTVTARPLPASADGRQRWDVQWEGRQGITSVQVTLKGQFDARHLANGSYTKKAIGQFVQGVNQHWAQEARQQQVNIARNNGNRTPPRAETPLTSSQAASPEESRSWATQASQVVQNMPVRLDVLDTRLGLAQGVPKDWFSQGVNGLANGLGNLVGDAVGMPESTAQQKLFAQHRATVSVYELNKANIPVDAQGRFELPNTEEAGRFFASLVAQAGQPGDPSGTGFHNVLRVGLALDKGLAQQYGLSPAFVRGYKQAQDQMAASGLYQAAQTLSSLGPMMASRRAAQRINSGNMPPPGRLDVVNGARTEVKPNAAPIEIKPLTPPVVQPQKAPASQRPTPNVTVQTKTPTPQIASAQKPPPRVLPDGNTIDITPLSSEVIKPVRRLPSQEMKNAIPTPLSTPINRPAVVPDTAVPSGIAGSARGAPRLGTGVPQLPGGNSLPPGRPFVVDGATTGSAGALNGDIRASATRLPAANTAATPRMLLPASTPVGGLDPADQLAAQRRRALQSLTGGALVPTLRQPGDLAAPPEPGVEPAGGGGNRQPPAKPPSTGGLPQGDESREAEPGDPDPAGNGGTNQSSIVLRAGKQAPRTIPPLAPPAQFTPPLPEPAWLKPQRTDGDLPFFQVPRPRPNPLASSAGQKEPMDATAQSRASGTPAPGVQTYFGLRNVTHYHHPETGELRPLLPGHETQLTIPDRLNIHRDADGVLVINHPITGQSWSLHEAAKAFPGKVFIATSPSREVLADLEQAKRSAAAASLAARGGPPPKSVLTVLGQAEAKIPTVGGVRLRINGTEGAKAAAELAKLSLKPGEWTALMNGESSPRLMAALQHLATKGFELKVTASSLDVPGGQNVMRRDDVIEVPLHELLRNRMFVSSQQPAGQGQTSLPEGQGAFRLPLPAELALYRFNGRELPGTQMVEYLGDPLTLVVKRTTGVDLSPSKLIAAKGAIEAQYEVKIRRGDLLPKSMVDKLSHQLTDTGTYSLEIKDGKIYPQINFRNDYARIIPSRTGLATTDWMDWLVPRKVQADQPKKIVVTGLGKLMGQSAGAVFSVDPKLIGTPGQTGVGGATAQKLWQMAELSRALPARGSQRDATQPLNRMMVEMPRANPLQPGHIPLVQVNVRRVDDRVQVEFSGLEDSAMSKYRWQDEAMLQVQADASVQGGAGAANEPPRILYVKVPLAVLQLMTDRALTAQQGQQALAWLRDNLPGWFDPVSGTRVPSEASQALLRSMAPALSGDAAPGTVSATTRQVLLQLLFGNGRATP